MQTVELQGVPFSFPVNGRFISDHQNFAIPVEHTGTRRKSTGTTEYLDEAEYINTALRQQRITEKQAEYINEIVTDVNNIGVEYPRITLFRGVKNFLSLADLKIGDCHTDLGFVSKTNNYKVALKFTWNNECCFCVIHYPETTKQYQPLSFINQEFEYLTYPGERFRLLDIGELVTDKRRVYYFEFIDWINGGPDFRVEPTVRVNRTIVENLDSDSVLVGIYKDKFMLLQNNNTQIFLEKLEYSFSKVWLLRDWLRLFSAKQFEYTFKSDGMLITKISDVKSTRIRNVVGQVVQMWTDDRIAFNPIIANAETLVSLRADGVEVALPTAIPTAL